MSYLDGPTYNNSRYVVLAHRIVCKVPGAMGGETYFRKGKQLPRSVEAAEIDRLLELGLIGVIEPGAVQ